MVCDLDIAWLAGVFDGEGCVHVQRFRRKNGRVTYSVILTLANTSSPLVERYISILRGLGVAPMIDFATKYTKRPIWYVKLQRKKDALVIAKAILPHSTAKHGELQMAIWYLERSCKTRQHVATKQEIEVLESIRSVKHGTRVSSKVKQIVDN